MSIAAAAPRVHDAVSNRKPLTSTFTDLAHNYRHLMIGDAFISTVEYAFLSMFRNCKRVELNEQALHEKIVQTMLHEETFYNEELIEGIYQALTNNMISTREMLNYQSAFDARRSKNKVFDSYYSHQMERAEKARKKIREGESVTDHEREQAKGVMIFPATIDTDIDKPRLMRRIKLLKTMQSSSQKLWKGVQVGSVVISLGTVWPGLLAAFVSILCIFKNYAIPLSIITGAGSAVFAGLSVIEPKRERTFRNWSIAFLSLLFAVIIGRFVGSRLSANSDAETRLNSRVEQGEVTPIPTPTSTPENSPYIASGTIAFDGVIKGRSTGRTMMCTQALRQNTIGLETATFTSAMI